jgi:ribosomal protein S18 acetylase RimI-like enzyme
MTGVKIRPLRPDEYEEIVNLWHKAGLPIKQKGRESREALLDQMKNDPDLFIGAEIDGRLAGVIIASSDGRKGCLNRVAVDPEFRGRGVAAALTLAAENVLHQKGIKIIGLLIHRSNLASRALAKKLGYIEHEDIVYLSKRESDEN